PRRCGLRVRRGGGGRPEALPLPDPHPRRRADRRQLQRGTRVRHPPQRGGEARSAGVSEDTVRTHRYTPFLEVRRMNGYARAFRITVWIGVLVNIALALAAVFAPDW